MKCWEGAIYESIESLGGEAGLQETYKRLSETGTLNEDQLRETKWGGRPAYQHVVRSYITNMCQSGLLCRVARGRYRIVRYVARE